MNFEKVSNMMHQLGYGKLMNKDVNILRETLDVDKDFRVSMDDLKASLSYISSKNK